MTHNIHKILFFLACLLVSHFTFSCTKSRIIKISNSIDSIKADVSSHLMNLIYLERQKKQLKRQQKIIRACLKHNLKKINKLTQLKKQSMSSGIYSPKLLTFFDRKNSKINKKQVLIEKVLLDSQNLMVLIGQDIFYIKNLSDEQADVKGVFEYWDDYRFAPNKPKIVLTPFGEILNVFGKINRILLYSVFSFAFICGFISIFFIKHLKQKKLSKNISLFIKYSQFILPIYIFTTLIDLFLNYQTYYWLTTPPELRIIDLFFRLFTLYILALFIICFFLKKGFNQEKMVNFLVKTCLIIGLTSFIEIAYLDAFKKTDFTQFIFLGFYEPILSLVIYNYLAYRWAFIQDTLPLTRFKTNLYRVFVIGIVFAYGILRTYMSAKGYVQFNFIRFLLIILVVIFYYRFLCLQFNLSEYFFKKNTFFLKKFKIDILTQQRHFFEKNIFLVSLNVLLLMLVINIIFYLFDAPARYSLWIHNFIFSDFNIGKLEFSLFNLVLAAFFFSLMVIIESIVSNYIISKKSNDDNFELYKTQVNISHHIFKAIAFIIALLILGISSTHLMVIIGSLGFGIGFGLQSIIENIICGLLIILKRNFLVGDTIQIINIASGVLIIQGRIKHVNLLDTVLINQNNSAVFIPNSGLFKNGVVTLSH